MNKVKNQVFGTQEWASYTENCINGCKHDCKYCYSKAMAIRFKRKTHKTWKREEIRRSSFNKRFNNREGTIMFPSAHDIHPDHLKDNLQFLLRLLEPGNNVLVVTKPHLECITKICKTCADFKDKILFRFTIGSTDSNILKFWEPGAPDYEERIEALKFAFESGYKTSISCEPLLDEDPSDLVEQTEKFVTDSIWIGKANFLLRRLKVNHVLDTQTVNAAESLIESQNDDNIREIYFSLKDKTKIKWKESIKKIVGIEIPQEIGLDI